WMTRTADAHEAGYLTYQRRSPKGLANQGWKDAFDAVMHANGDLANPPIALVEVQGYQYAAMRGMAHLAEVRGASELAESLTKRSERLRERFESDFWMADEAYYAMALDGEGRPCRVVTSNPGHLLWTRLPAAGRAQTVAARLMDNDMFTGWGVRTHGSRNPRLHPNELPQGLGVAARPRHRRGGHAALRPGRAVPDADNGAVRGGPAVRGDADARALLRLPPPARIRSDPL